MADMMYGPTLVTDQGRAIRTRLFALIDDHSRLCPYGEYFSSEGSDCFMAVLYEAIRSRGLEQGKNRKVFSPRSKAVPADVGL